MEEWLGVAVATGELSGIFKHNEFVKAMQQQLNCDEDSAIVRLINYGPCIREKMIQLLMKFPVNQKHWKK